MIANGTHRLLLRAEIHHGRRVLVTNTLSISSTSVRLASNEALRPGTALRIVLSFPNLVAPFEIQARVAENDPDQGPGHPASLLCDITAAPGHASDVLAALVALGAVAAEVAEEAARPTGEHGAYRCLLVEDNGFIRDLFSYGLDKYGRTRRTDVSLDLAEDAESAWRMLRASTYDLAIIDHYLPLETGAELIARMRKEPALARIPVVAISVGGAEAREASMAAGADLFLDKPIVLRDLFSTLDRLTHGASHHPS